MRVERIADRDGGEVSYGAQAIEWRGDETSLKVNWYPQCCTAKVLNTFGNSENAYSGGVDAKEYEDVHKGIGLWIKWARCNEDAILTAVTTSEQEEANEALEKYGFIRSEAIRNVKYPDSFLYNWYLPLNGYVDPEVINEDGEFVPIAVGEG